MNANVPLSKLVASRVNPRRVRPGTQANRTLAASIRAHGVLEPLLVRPENGHYRVIAGNRRLAMLRSIHGDEDAAIPCVVRKVEGKEAEELSLAENYCREGMHPLDEAECFARLASVEHKGILAIAAEFGVREAYVRQRMKLAGLCETVKEAFRSGRIVTATAEAFASVPAARQQELWKETGGNPRHAQHVRNLIEDRWIDAGLALFDVATIPPGLVSSDLFRERVLIERAAFMEAQAGALARERERLLEDGWAEVVVAERSEIQSRLYSMEQPMSPLSREERSRLDRLESRLAKLEAEADPDASDVPEASQIDQEMDRIRRQAEGRYGESVRSRGTVFLVLSPGGEVERHYRVSRPSAKKTGGPGSSAGAPESEPAPTADDLSDRQRAAVFTHRAIAVRHAVAGSPLVRKRLLVLALHDRVTTDALAIRHAANGTTIHVAESDTLKSKTFDALCSRREAIDPFKDKTFIEEDEAYQALCRLPEKVLNQLIDVLTVDLLTGHGQRETPLLAALSGELKVSIRQHWTPDAEWLSGYQRVQLADLIGTLKGPAHCSAALKRKKSELVSELATLFATATKDSVSLNEPALAERVTAWMPQTGE